MPATKNLWQADTAPPFHLLAFAVMLPPRKGWGLYSDWATTLIENFEWEYSS
jgi:hypothetical protein